MISANTLARAEGCFRFECKPAVDRPDLDADNAPFLYPVVIDDTPVATGRVLRDAGLSDVRGCVFFYPLYDDPRWLAFLRKMGVAETAPTPPPIKTTRAAAAQTGVACPDGRAESARTP